MRFNRLLPIAAFAAGITLIATPAYAGVDYWGVDRDRTQRWAKRTLRLSHMLKARGHAIIRRLGTRRRSGAIYGMRRPMPPTSAAAVRGACAGFRPIPKPGNIESRGHDPRVRRLSLRRTLKDNCHLLSP